MSKRQQKSGWRVTFDISPDTQLKNDGTPYHMTTGSVQHGEQVFMAEFPLTEWSADMTAFFEKARAFFFNLELKPLPDCPDMTDAAQAPDPGSDQGQDDTPDDADVSGDAAATDDEGQDDTELVADIEPAEYFPASGDDFMPEADEEPAEALEDPAPASSEAAQATLF